MSKSAPVKRSVRPPAGRSSRVRQLRQWNVALLAVAAVAAVAASLLLALPGTKTSSSAARVSDGLAPAFAGRDLVSGRPISTAGLRGKNVLLFFNEGVSCSPCFEQIRSLEQRDAELKRRRLTLVSIATDSPGILRQAAAQYWITTPVLSDQARSISTAYGAIGQGMHPDTDGHTFVLVDRGGRIRWRRNYTAMFVPPDELFAAIPNVN